MKTKTVVMRSNTNVFESHKYHTVTEIKLDGPAWTRFFVDGELVRQVNFVDNRSIDWVLP